MMKKKESLRSSLSKKKKYVVKLNFHVIQLVSPEYGDAIIEKDYDISKSSK